uniref:Movement protein TGBp3 n=1 Tax=Carrot carlavirus WM-2008 TaxID=552517 RepID=B5AZR6_9VIRU|nr:triple gene block protein 3 [Carrot carlavirus WM-2008]
MPLGDLKILFLGFFCFISALAILNLLSGSSNNLCVVVITGESIKISGCVFDDNFAEYARTLTIPNHWG